MSGVGINVSAMGSSNAEVKIRLSLDAGSRKLIPPAKITGWLNEALQFGVQRARGYVRFDTGELYNSIGMEVHGASGSLFASAEHALPIEFGHRTRSGSFVPASPFLRPAAEDTFTYLERIVTRDLTQGGLEVFSS